LASNKNRNVDLTNNRFSSGSISEGNKDEAYLIKFKDVNQGKKLLSSHNKRIDKEFRHSPIVTAHLSDDEVADLQKDHNIDFIEKDHLVQKAGDIVGGNLQQIQIPKAHAMGASGKNVRVAILDTGVNMPSKELRISGGASFVLNEPNYDDLNGHGTHVAGILAALDDDQGLIGVSPNINLFTVKVLNQKGTGTYSSLIEGIEWAMDHRMDMVVMSLSGKEPSSALAEAIQLADQLGILLIAAAGNDGVSSVGYPARYKEVMAIGAVDHHNQLARFSNTGSEIDLVAPGVDIQGLSLSQNYVSMSGTSLAVPHVAGIAALIKELYPNFSGQDIKKILNDSAGSLGNANHFGKGLVNAEAALQRASHLKKVKEKANRDAEKWGTLSPKQLDLIQAQFTPTMLQVSAFLNPYLTKLLTSEQQSVLSTWKEKEVIQIIRGFTSNEIKLLDDIVPNVRQFLNNFDKNGENAKNPKKEKKHTKTAAELYVTDTKAFAATSNSITEYTFDYQYKANSDGLVDPIYHSANRRVVDLSLQGKAGLDFQLSRIYSSLDSKVLFPDYQGGNVTNRGPSSNYEALESVIATGWKLNLPFMQQGQGQTIEEEVESGFTHYWPSSYEKLTFTLEDGSTYEVHNDGDETHINQIFKGDDINPGYPFDDVSFSKALIPGTSDYEYYLKTDSGRITYTFDEDGFIKSKSNEYGAKITYQFNWDYTNNNSNIIITDSYNRIITVYRTLKQDTDWHWVITGFKVEETGTKIKELNYHLTKNSEPAITNREFYEGSYQNVSHSNLTFYKLNSVYDVTYSSPGVKLESYDYWPVSMGMADFNYGNMGYWYPSDANGNPEPNKSPYFNWRSNNSMFEHEEIANERDSHMGELAYLLLRTVDFNNGLSVDYHYQYYTGNWLMDYLYQEDRETARKTTRLYVDPYALSYIGYHPVQNLTYRWNSKDFQNYTNSYSRNDFYYNHQLVNGIEVKEFWQNAKQNIKRLRTNSRKGDQQVQEHQEYTSGGDNKRRTFSYYLKHGQKFVLGASWIRNDFTFENWKLDMTDNTDSTRYHTKRDEVTAYLYSNGLPARINVFATEIDENNPGSIWPIVNTLENTKNKTVEILEYDSFGKPIKHIDPLGNITTYEYHDPFHSISKTSVSSNDTKTTLLTEYSYYGQDFNDSNWNNKYNQLKQIKTTQTYWDPSLNSFQSDQVMVDYKQYNSNHQVLQTDEYASGTQFAKAGEVTRTDFTYTSNGYLRSETVTARLGENVTKTSLTTSYTYDNVGHIRSITYPDGSSSSFGTYDALERPSSYSFQPIGASQRLTTVAYFDSDRKVSISLPDGEQQDTIYSPFGVLMYQQRTTKNPANQESTSRFVHQNVAQDGVTITQSIPYGNQNMRTFLNLDSQGRVLGEFHPENQYKLNYYSNYAENASKGTSYLQTTVKTVYPDNRIEYAYFDSYGRLSKSVQKGMGYGKERTTDFTYDSFGNVTKETVSSEGKTQVSEYGYDAMGHLIYLKDAENNQYRYVYDHKGNLLETYTNNKLQVTKMYNELGWLLKKTQAGGEKETYTYTSVGLVDTYTDKSGQVSAYQYTPYREVDLVTIKNSSGATVYTNDYEYDSKTRLLSSVTNSEQESFKYFFDQWKRLGKQIVAGRTYSMDYDAYDRLSILTYPDNKQVTFSLYDNLNRIKSVAYPDMGEVTNEYKVNSNWNEYNILYPNNMKQSRITDALGELQLQNHMIGSTYWYNSYTFDEFGNVQTNNQNGVNHTYEYDKMNRIKKETTPADTKRYTYDERGNRQTQESETLNIDPVGQNLTYNALNQLKTFNNDKGTTASYTYYGDGLRATKTVNGQTTRYVYLNGKVIEELDENGNVKARNIWGNELLFRKDYTKNKNGYYWYNGHGDVVKITDASGNELNRYEYDIWGNLTEQTEGMSNPFKYTGEMYDDETGLYYLRARYYDPSMGRFISEDTYEGELNNPLSLNQYTYVLNNPLKYIDPTGNRAEANGGGTNPQNTVKWKSVSELTPQEMGALLDNPNLSENDKAQILAAMFLSIFAPDGGGSFVAKDASKYVKSFINLFKKGMNVTDSSPIRIPDNAKMVEQVKSGYDQIKYTWSDGAYKYEARWHTRTPGAPANQGNTWVITRTTPGSQTERKVQHIMTGANRWTPMYEWQNAIRARQNGTATANQQALLDSGHWQAP
jgi:RHS repeat-associated protein